MSSVPIDPKKLSRGIATGETVSRIPRGPGTASPRSRITSSGPGVGAASIPVRRTSAREALRRITVRTRISSLSAVSVPFRSFVGSVSAIPRRWASSTAASRLSPSAIRPRTRLLVLLNTPRSRRNSAATRSRRPAFTTGSPPQTVALQPSPAPFARARDSISSKASATADLLANTTEVPHSSAVRAAVRPIPPVSMSIEAASSRIPRGPAANRASSSETGSTSGISRSRTPRFLAASMAASVSRLPGASGPRTKPLRSAHATTGNVTP